MSYSLLEAAQAILSRLNDLPDSSELTEIKNKLPELLKKGESASSDIRNLLNSHPTVKQWKYNLLNSDESQRKDFRHFDEVPGRITATTHEPPLYPIYQCPECDYQWAQHQRWDTPPLCPHHNTLLHKLES